MSIPIMKACITDQLKIIPCPKKFIITKALANFRPDEVVASGSANHSSNALIRFGTAREAAAWMNVRTPVRRIMFEKVLRRAVRRGL